MPSRLARLLAAAVAVAVGIVVAPLPGQPLAAAAGEVYSRPDNGVFRFAGHGWGHGRGMSQYGAQGAAGEKGLTADQITAFYYKGTSAATLADTDIRVRVACNGVATACTSFVASGAQGLRFVDATKGGYDLPTNRSRWRVRVDAAGFHLDGLDGSTWRPQSLGGASAWAGPVQLSRRSTASSSVVRLWYPRTSGVVWREYRGILRAVRSTSSSTALHVVDVVRMEQYLLGVVPRESISSWPAAALQSQAVAARSYAAFVRAAAASGAAWHICDTTMCQVYGGYAYGTAAAPQTRNPLEPASTTAAVKATAGRVRTWQGKSIFAQYSASNGGWSTAGSQPYLVAQRDPYDGLTGSSVHSWAASLPAAALEKRFPSVGRLLRMRVTERDGNGDWGGRVREVVLEGRTSGGTATTVRVSGAEVYQTRPWPSYADGLRSSWWKPVVTAPTITAPARVARATTMTFAGTAAPGAAVDLYLRLQGTTNWSRRSLTAAGNGAWSSSYRPTVDVQAYALSGGRKSPVVSTTAYGTTIAGPATAAKGSKITVSGWAAPGASVVQCWRHTGVAGCAHSTATRATSTGRWAVAHTVTVTHTYYASAAGYTSRTITTKVG